MESRSFFQALSRRYRDHPIDAPARGRFGPRAMLVASNPGACRVFRDFGGVAVLLVTFACAGTMPNPSPTSQLPPPRDGAASCAQASAESDLVRQLSRTGVRVTAVSGSTDVGLFTGATSVCLFDVGRESFEVAFFATADAAAADSICETQSGGRYLYQVGGHEIDAAYRLYWTISGSLILWTNSGTLNEDIRRSQGGVTPSCPS
jgi:hypothetical protein